MAILGPKLVHGDLTAILHLLNIKVNGRKIDIKTLFTYFLPMYSGPGSYWLGPEKKET